MPGRGLKHPATTTATETTTQKRTTQTQTNKNNNNNHKKKQKQKLKQKNQQRWRFPYQRPKLSKNYGNCGYVQMSVFSVAFLQRFLKYDASDVFGLRMINIYP